MNTTAEILFTASCKSCILTHAATVGSLTPNQSHVASNIQTKWHLYTCTCDLYQHLHVYTTSTTSILNTFTCTVYTLVYHTCINIIFLWYCISCLYNHNYVYLTMKYHKYTSILIYLVHTCLSDIINLYYTIYMYYNNMYIYI